MLHIRRVNWLVSCLQMVEVSSTRLFQHPKNLKKTLIVVVKYIVVKMKMKISKELNPFFN